MVPPDGLSADGLVTVQRQSQCRPCVFLDRLHPVVELNAGDVVIAIVRRRQRSNGLSVQVRASTHVVRT